MNKDRTRFLLALAGVLVLASGIGAANAYFTTYTEARGGVTLSLGSTTSIEEKVIDKTKQVQIVNEAGSQPVYVRVKAFAGSAYTLTYTSEGAAAWLPGSDGYYYYNRILSGGEATDVLRIEIGGLPEDPGEDETFNVAVVYESVPVIYDQNGFPREADWTASLITSEEETAGLLEGRAD